MRYQSKSAIAYLGRNFGKLVYVALPIAVLMAFFANPSREAEFLYKLIKGQLTFDNVFVLFNDSFTVLRFGKFWWVELITVLLLAFTVSMLIVKISRHMRVGIMPALPFKNTLRLFPTTLLALVCLFCLEEITVLLSVGVMYILRGTENVTLVATFGVAIAFVTRMLCAWIFMLLILALPLRYSENYHFNIGLSHSVRVMSKLPKAVWTVTLVYAFGRYVVMLCGFLLKPYHIDVIVYALTYLFVVLFMPVFAYKIYYDFVGGERRDIYQIMFD